MNQRHAVTDPWVPFEAYRQISNITGSTALAVGAMNSAANRGIAIPITLPCAMTLYALRFYAGNATGNYDLGLYDSDYSRIASKGSTAMAAGLQTLTLPDLRYPAGKTLFAALTLSSTSGTVLRGTFGAANRLDMIGITNMASSLPLPNPWVGAAPTETIIPVFSFGVR